MILKKITSEFRLILKKKHFVYFKISKNTLALEVINSIQSFLLAIYSYILTDYI